VPRLGDTLKLMPDVRLVIIDPLINFLPGIDLDNYGEIAPALADLVEAAGKSGIAIVAIHHTKKRDTAETGDSVLGSSAIIGAMCTSLFLSGEMGNTRTIKSSQRYGTRLEATELEFDSYTSSFSLGSTATAAQQRRATLTREDRISNILLHTPQYPNGIMQEDLRALVGCSTKDLGEQLTALESEGRVTRSGEGKNGSPFFYSVPNHVTVESESPAAVI
jgi:AAA domain